MKLDDFEQRRAHLARIERQMDYVPRVGAGSVEIHNEPLTTRPKADFNIWPNGDGRWRASGWTIEHGDLWPVNPATADTLDLALDWIWWASTLSFRQKWVLEGRRQWDLKNRDMLPGLLRVVAKAGLKPPEGQTFRRMTKEPWADRSSNSLALGFVALLVGQQDTATTERLARNPRTPTRALTAMAVMGKPIVRAQVALNPNASPETIKYLRQDTNFLVHWYLAARGDVPTEQLVNWSHSDPALWTAVLERPDLTSAQLVALDEASSGGLRAQILRHRAATPELFPAPEGSAPTEEPHSREFQGEEYRPSPDDVELSRKIRSARDLGVLEAAFELGMLQASNTGHPGAGDIFRARRDPTLSGTVRELLADFFEPDAIEDAVQRMLALWGEVGAYSFGLDEQNEIGYLVAKHPGYSDKIYRRIHMMNFARP